MWHITFGGPVPEHKTYRYQCHGSRQISSHVISEELFHPGICCPLCSTTRR
uniref:Uncharacterized protein n=1 Tax=Timema shepardi TaxID=629360 RepID=A0A7R9FW27_TIMSH|nr:unnamed protein product [Timema shepardi]